MYKCYLISLQVLHAPTSIVVTAVYVASNSLGVMLDMTSVMLFDILQVVDCCAVWGVGFCTRAVGVTTNCSWLIAEADGETVFCSKFWAAWCFL
jgi:hypothetical protein